MDRRLIGLLGMAVLVSTAFAVIFFVDTTEEDIEIIRNYWQAPSLEGWKRLPLSEEMVPYTLSLVARKPLEELSVRFGILRNNTLDVNYTGWQDLSIRQKALRVGNLDYLDSRATDISEGLDVEPIEQEFELVLRDEEYRVYIIDYHPCIAPLASPIASIDVPYIFAFLFDGDGNISQFYSGYWDFFEKRELSIQDMTIQLNENATRYANDQNMGEGDLPLNRTLEMLGKITFNELKPDDRIFITYRVNGGAVWGEEAFMQIIRLNVNGEYRAPLINILKR